MFLQQSLTAPSLPPRLPAYPSYLFPYALDLHQPPVTALHYTANCCDEFIASLHSVKSKLVKTKTPAKVYMFDVYVSILKLHD